MTSIASLSWTSVAATGIVAALTYVVFRLVQERRFHNDKPKPPHHWFWGHLKLLGEAMRELPPNVHYQAAVTSIAHKHNLDGVFYLDLWPATWSQMVVVDPELAHYMTVTKNHPKHEAEAIFMDPLIGVGNIVSSNGPEWKHLHKMLSPAFSVQNVTNIRPAIAEELMEFRSILREKADEGKTFSFEELASHSTFDVIGKATFGHSLNAKTQGSAALVHWEATTRAVAASRDSWNLIKNFRNQRIIKAELKKLDALLADMIKQRYDVVEREKADLSNKKGLCIMDLIMRDYIAEARQSGKVGLDREFLRVAIMQVKTLLVAGTGTTSDTICFTMMLLSVHPEVVRKLREEHDAIFAKGIDASYELLQREPFRLNQLEYTANVIKEVLRFYPIGNSPRAELPTERYLEYKGQRYPTKGRLVTPMQLSMQMDPEIFTNPTKFDPERYTKQDFPRHAWRPFERGPRGCLGLPLAMDELKIALLLTIRDFDFTCADLKPNKTQRVAWTDWDLTFGDRAFQEFVFEARPRDGMPMIVKRSNWGS